MARTGADAIKLMGANCGDSRVLMIKDGQPPVQLTVDHVPDLESERQRIEDQKARNSKCVPEREREREELRCGSWWSPPEPRHTQQGVLARSRTPATPEGGS